MSLGPVTKRTEKLVRSVPSYTILTFDGGKTRERNIFEGYVDVRPFQEIISQGNPWPSGRGKGNTGGPFYSSKFSYMESGTGPFLLGNFFYGQEGQIYPKSPPAGGWHQGNWPARVVPSSNEFLFGLGGTAIARCEPTNPVFGASVALAELKRDGLPEMVGQSFFKERLANVLSRESAVLSKNGKVIAGPSSKMDKASLKNIGQENLNYQFAIRPLLSDVKKLRKSVRDTDKILRDFERNSEKVVRRSYEFPEESSETVEVIDNAFCTAGSSYFYSGPGRLTTTTKTTRRRWFSGAFVYAIPKSDIGRFMAEADKLYGIKVTPETVWNAAPWSWAADWIANYGDLIHNVNAFGSDGLVMRYGYLMEHSFQRVTYNWEGDLMMNWSGPRPVSTTQIFEHEVKKRVAASPYGFGLNVDLSPRQIGIIASLGITQGRR